ncbi:(2Fe-2S)-binding protein [Parvibaculaceae bacterium PLY_AMNH_Bact1]|nr:(2Fe-2S)-binding protein [Parvibaculaceae bacterium PLY_AMNH_Bact1]
MDITVNGRVRQVEDAAADNPLLWVLRDELGLVGTKFGCGIGTCGACTIHVDGSAVRSCQITPGDIVGHDVTTIEGLAATASTASLHPVQQAWIDHSVPQCGYCQAGQIMSAAALLAENPSPSDSDIDRDMSGNLCRCGTYARIRSAIKQAARNLSSESDQEAS